MTTRVQELEARLEIGSQDVRMVGIWGVGGSGKTTLASSLSKKISRHFQGHCIVDNIREDTIKHGLKVLQQIIISRLLKIEMDLQDVEEGKRTISRLSRSKVLIILDDVDDRKQLEALAGSHNWFGSGSRIIITTRNEHLLHKANLIYPIKLLSDEEAIQLFNIRAYNVNAPLNDYNTLSLCVVSYAARLPLALKVLGSFLYDKNEMEWRSALDRLKVIPQTEIMEQLKISYDGLESDEKELFLDIACFFLWEVEDKAMEILEACGYHYHIGIKVLRQKALITIVDGMFDMHDLIQEMGHYIVRKKHPNDPSKHSRVWKDEEIRNMCLSDATMDNDKIEAIGCRRYPDDSSLFYRFVSNMKKLRYLYAAVGCRFSHDEVDEIVEGPKFLSNELRYMEWMNYPSTPFPDTFKPVKLVILKLKWSLPKHLWNGYKHFPQLKVLHLQHMTNLLSTPDFDGLPSLQKLTLNDCKSLEKIHSSLGKHSSLEHVSVVQCWKLTMFPTIVGMRKLTTLEIIGSNGWNSNFEFPEIKSNMESLVKLSLEDIGIDALLSSLGERCPSLISVRLFSCFCLMSIKEVNFDGLKHLEEFKLYALLHRKMPNESGHRLFTMPIMLSLLSCNLRKLDLDSCMLIDGALPSSIGEMSNLEELYLGMNLFTRLGFTLSELPRLKLLDMSRCNFLVELPMLPSSLMVLRALDNCPSLTSIGNSHTNCKWLCDVTIEGKNTNNDCRKLLQLMFQGGVVGNYSILFHATKIVEIAKEFMRPRLIRGSSRCTLKLPENWFNDHSGFLICVIDQNYSFRVSWNFVSMKAVMIDHMEDEDDVVCEECDMEIEDEDEDEDEVVLEESESHKYLDIKYWYVPFDSLRDTTWWNSIYMQLADSICFHFSGLVRCNNEIRVRMVARKDRSGSMEEISTPQQQQSDFSRYAPKVNITHDSQRRLNIESTKFWK